MKPDDNFHQRLLMIHFHANGEDISSTIKYVETLCHLLKVHVLAVEYPGYGIYPESSGNNKV